MAAFNLKLFVEDFSIARESGDLDAEAELLSKFNRFITTSNPQIKEQSKDYIVNNRIANQYPDLLDIVRAFSSYF